MRRFRELIHNHGTGVSLTALLLSATLMLVFQSSPTRGGFGELGLSIVGIVQQSTAWVAGGVSSTIGSVSELGNLRSDYEALLEQLLEYEATQQDLVELRQELDSLRELLGFSQQLETRNIPARVIGKDPGNFFSTISINKGRRDGMRVDLPVIAVQDNGEGLVGRIAHVGSTSSIVRPIFDSASFVAARLQSSRHEGLVSGGGIGNNVLLMRYVPEGTRGEIGYGDVVVTSGMSEIFPAGIRIGRVRSISSQPYETSLELELGAVVDFSRLEYVLVIVPSYGGSLEMNSQIGNNYQ